MAARSPILQGGRSKPYLSMGAVFLMFGGIYYWFDQITGIKYSEILG